jgi:NAD(P)-dependent dehydrogenase (short-subunit alcohol dehydrogenase family)
VPDHDGGAQSFHAGVVNMKVIVFGASGATGRELVKQAVAQGHLVTAFVRNPARFDIERPSIHVEQGDVADRGAVERAIGGQDEVICALGGSSLLTRNPALVIGVHNILAAMEEAGVRRLVYLSNDAVSDARSHMNVFRLLCARLCLREENVLGCIAAVMTLNLSRFSLGSRVRMSPNLC